MTTKTMYFVGDRHCLDCWLFFCIYLIQIVLIYFSRMSITGADLSVDLSDFSHWQVVLFTFMVTSCSMFLIYVSL